MKPEDFMRLDAIFAPRSIAVVGASSQDGKVGNAIFSNLLHGHFNGVLYPVNPAANHIMCVKAYNSILDIPDVVDLAMIILPPKRALQTVEHALQKGVKGIVIVSAGFREVGPEGRALEDKIVALCHAAGVPVVGPNCLGVINPMHSMNASFSTRLPKAGNISFISQSGALCTAVLDFAADRDFGFSKFISIGNKADVDELDLLRYLHQDRDTEVIMIYLEELRRSGPEFIDTVKHITTYSDRPTPILVIKSGRTNAGAAAAASHTGALAGSEAVYDSIFEQAGMIRVDSINDLFDFASCFTMKDSQGRRKVPAGNQVAIVTNAGGPGIVATDMTISSGLELATLNEETVEALKSHLPATANFHNPVDVIGDAGSDRYENALTAVIHDTNVDGAIVILTPQSMTNVLETAKSVVRIKQTTTKPILCVFMGILDVSTGVKYLQEHGVPVFKFPESAARAFGALSYYAKWLERQHLAQFPLKHDEAKAKEIIDVCLSRGQTYLGEIDGLDLLRCYGFPVLETKLATTAAEAADLAEAMGFPAVLKIVSPQIIHKSDAGGVMIKLKDREQVMAGFEEIVANAKKFDAQAEIKGCLVTTVAPKGREVILGANRYPVFGPLIMFGFGGIFVEVFKDVAFRLAPIKRNEARRMMHKIKAYHLLKEFRGTPASDIETLEKLLVSLSDMVTNHPEIQELDINPLLVHGEGQGATVADCRILLKAPEQPN